MKEDEKERTTIVDDLMAENPDLRIELEAGIRKYTEYFMMPESTTYAEYLIKRTLRGLDDSEPPYDQHQFTTAHEFG